jgi:hypothetical protein
MEYSAAWDASKQYGCKCDLGYRGPDCSLKECPSGTDPQGGPSNTLFSTAAAPAVASATILLTRLEPRDCSGRGMCDYSTGNCNCFKGFFGEDCSLQTALV